MAIETTHRESDSRYVSRVWTGRIEGAARMTSIATSTSELVFWSDAGVPRVSVRGPETAASTADIVGDSETFGITLAHGTSMAPLPNSALIDNQWDSPNVTARGFVLAGEEFEVPGVDDAEALVDRLVRAGILVRDPMVEDVVWGGIARVGTRSVQRRVAAATGLTQGAIRQIERARLAAALLEEGTPALEVVHRCGYFDQPHLARSLQRFIGRTATQLQRPDASAHPLSLLYKPRALPDS
ncbi:helix-turn-helix domain-containing protein [Leifsonia sp. SIMBA_070]|uniref:helix-turn-helix domain-containing protein n=2 Tax=Bacillati TaxID=1783272 RepID=UPI00397A19FA